MYLEVENDNTIAHLHAARAHWHIYMALGGDKAMVSSLMQSTLVSVDVFLALNDMIMTIHLPLN